MNNPTKGFDVVVMRASAKGLPKPLKAWLMRLMLIKNKYRKNKTAIILEMLDGVDGAFPSMAFQYSIATSFLQAIICEVDSGLSG